MLYIKSVDTIQKSEDYIRNKHYKRDKSNKSNKRDKRNPTKPLSKG